MQCFILLWPLANTQWERRWRASAHEVKEGTAPSQFKGQHNVYLLTARKEVETWRCPQVPYKRQKNADGYGRAEIIQSIRRQQSITTYSAGFMTSLRVIWLENCDQEIIFFSRNWISSSVYFARKAGGVRRINRAMKYKFGRKNDGKWYNLLHASQFTFAITNMLILYIYYYLLRIYRILLRSP